MYLYTGFSDSCLGKMRYSTILLVVLLAVPVVVAQLAVYHNLNQISADGGLTSIDPDNDGQINASFVENGDIWVRNDQVVDSDTNLTITLEDGSRLIINNTEDTGAPLFVRGEHQRAPGQGSDDNNTYIFLTDESGGEIWGLQAQDDGDLGIHEAGRTTPFLIKANTGKVGINLTDTAVTDPATALEVNGVITADGFSGDGSQLTNLPSTAGSVSCVTQSASFSSSGTIACSSGSMTGGGTDCSPGGPTGGRVVVSRPSGNGWLGQCISPGSVYVRCCSIV